MKKLFMRICCVLLCMMLASLIACNDEANDDIPDLYQKGIEVTTIMGEMVNSETYAEMIGMPDIDFKFVQAQDYNTPISAYKISEPSFEKVMQALSSIEKTQLDELSDVLKEQLKNRYSFFSIVNALNGYGGAMCTVISSCFTAEKKFEGEISSSVYYLYIFESGQPIFVGFEPLDNKRFIAKGQFVLADIFTSLSSVKEIFEPFGCTVENVK